MRVLSIRIWERDRNAGVAMTFGTCPEFPAAPSARTCVFTLESPTSLSNTRSYLVLFNPPKGSRALNKVSKPK